MWQCRSSPVAVSLGAGALLALLPGLCGRGRLSVRQRSGSVPVQLRHHLDTKHAGTGVLMRVTSSLVSHVMRSGVLMMSSLAGVPPGRRPPRLALLHCLLLCQASFPAAVPAAQEALPGGADGRGLPAGHQPGGPPPPHLQLDQQRCTAAALPAGGAAHSLINQFTSSLISDFRSKYP